MTTPLTAPPYGQDTTATDRVYYGQLSSGAQLVGEALYRRLITPTGMLEDDPEYGFAIFTYLQRSGPSPATADLLALRSRITRECLKDERVEDVVVTLTPTTSGPTFSADIKIDVTLDDSTTFTLALNVNDVTLALLGISEAS